MFRYIDKTTAMLLIGRLTSDASKKSDTLPRRPTARETTRISANGTPNLSTSVVVPGGLPRAIPVSAIPKIHTER
jgi:hypothetical protein